MWLTLGCKAVLLTGGSSAQRAAKLHGMSLQHLQQGRQDPGVLQRSWSRRWEMC